jgi:hypothetical protein
MEDEMWIIGQVVYRDEVGTVRVTRFCRRYNKTSGRFSPEQDQEYEGAD